MRIVIADDQRIVREGLATIVGSLPDTEVVGVAADGAEAVELVESNDPDVVLMDLRMPTMDGAEATSIIRRRYPRTQVVVLTTYADDESALAALAAGAIGYLTKDAGRDDIRRALEAAAAGQGVLDHHVQARLIEAASLRAARPLSLPDGLTEREAEVLGLIAEGLSNSEIAARLYVSEATVKTHVNRVFAKTHSRDRAQAMTYARHHGLAP
jgi:DNA-binding NarL/FixJ family response regulator